MDMASTKVKHMPVFYWIAYYASWLQLNVFSKVPKDCCIIISHAHLSQSVMYSKLDMCKDRFLSAQQISHMSVQASNFTGYYIVWSADHWSI